MDFKVGDEVKLVNERLARKRGVWQAVGKVTHLVDDGTSLKRVSVKFPNAEPIVGMENGQFELA